MIRQPPRSTPCPYTPLSRSPRLLARHGQGRGQGGLRRRRPAGGGAPRGLGRGAGGGGPAAPPLCGQDRKSTRLNSSHANISYAVFCLKKKNTAVSATSTGCC